MPTEKQISRRKFFGKLFCAAAGIMAGASVAAISEVSQTHLQHSTVGISDVISRPDENFIAHARSGGAFLVTGPIIRHLP